MLLFEIINNQFFHVINLLHFSPCLRSFSKIKVKKIVFSLTYLQWGNGHSHNFCHSINGDKKNQFCLLMSVGQRVSPSYFDQERSVIELKIWSLTIKNKINKKLTL